jgi:hypothetical protein
MSEPSRDVGANGSAHSRDYRELVIEALAGDEAKQIDRIVDLREKCDTYAELFKQALQHWHDEQRQRKQYQRLYYDLLKKDRQGGAR